MDVKVDSLDYLLMPGKCHFGSLIINQYNTVYSHWKTLWTQEFSSVGNQQPLAADDFMRQDIIASLWSGSHLVAFHLYCLFDLDQIPTLDHRYFSIFDSVAIETLTKRKASRLMSMEFLSVHPDWRKSKTGISLAAVMVGLGMKIMQNSDLQATIAPAKKTAKIDDLALAFGSTCLRKDVYRGNIHCDLMACFKADLISYPDPQVNGGVQSLWLRRQDPLNLLSLARFERGNKIAA
ncbi:MAG: hypothetical protein IPK04_21200 [Bdellovibrionales bacterium]|nr:hypothetical protein [Bdellovibrionales bacterium]